jgi:transposase
MVKEQIKKLKINMLEWAPKSPDLNAIEELWSIIDKKLASTPINSKEELQHRLKQECNKISIKTCRALVDSMPERIEKCLKASRGHFL